MGFHKTNNSVSQQTWMFTFYSVFQSSSEVRQRSSYRKVAGLIQAHGVNFGCLLRRRVLHSLKYLTPRITAKQLKVDRIAQRIVCQQLASDLRPKW